MEREFVPYELAVSLKALGFDEECFGYFHVCEGYTKGYAFCYFNEPERYESDSAVLAPTFSQAFRWFRKKYGLFIQPNRTIDSEGIWYYFSIASKRTDVCEGSFVYEEAERACLEKLIEIRKEGSKPE